MVLQSLFRLVFKVSDLHFVTLNFLLMISYHGIQIVDIVVKFFNGFFIELLVYQTNINYSLVPIFSLHNLKELFLHNL